MIDATPAAFGVSRLQSNSSSYKYKVYDEMEGITDYSMHAYFHSIQFSDTQGYWHQSADEMHGMATIPQGNQELLVVRDKVGRPPGELGVSKSMECDIFPSVL